MKRIRITESEKNRIQKKYGIVKEQYDSIEIEGIELSIIITKYIVDIIKYKESFKVVVIHEWDERNSRDSWEVLEDNEISLSDNDKDYIIEQIMDHRAGY